ncbi:MAG: hypothetical protein ABFD98_15895 [Syntrophobacteraceae bacterium]
MLKILCSKCQADVPEEAYELLMRNLIELSITDNWRVREISNEIRDGFPQPGQTPASEEEKEAVIQLGHELIALALYQPILCKKCGEVSYHTLDPKSNQPSPFALSPEERRAAFRLLPGGKNDKQSD